MTKTLKRKGLSSVKKYKKLDQIIFLLYDDVICAANSMQRTIPLLEWKLVQPATYSTNVYIVTCSSSCRFTVRAFNNFMILKKFSNRPFMVERKVHLKVASNPSNPWNQPENWIPQHYMREIFLPRMLETIES